MTIEEIKAYLSENAQEQEVIDLIRGLVTTEQVNAFLETENGKQLIKPRLDSFFSKGLETWKTNNLNTIVEQEISKRNPAETEDQKRIKNIELQLQQERAERLRRENENAAMKLLESKKLPLTFAEFVMADTVEGITTKIASLESVINALVTQKVEERFETGGRVPNNPTPNKGGKQENPWMKETFNLTEQGKLLTTQPELAALFMKQAKRN